MPKIWVTFDPIMVVKGLIPRVFLKSSMILYPGVNCIQDLTLNISRTKILYNDVIYSIKQFYSYIFMQFSVIFVLFILN